MFKVEIKSSVNLNKFSIDPKELEGPITSVVEAAVQSEGCQHCHGKNLTVYINEVERTVIRGLYYCHDCNQEGPFILQHNVIDQVEAIVKNFQNEMKKNFST